MTPADLTVQAERAALRRQFGSQVRVFETGPAACPECHVEPPGHTAQCKLKPGAPPVAVPVWPHGGDAA